MSYKPYWSGLKPRLSTHILSQLDNEILDYIDKTTGFVTFQCEDIDTKITKNKNFYKRIEVILAENLDLLRGVHVSYSHLAMAQLALTLRTIFELHVNLKYIVCGPDPDQLSDRYLRFFHVEKYVASMQSSNLPQLTQAEIDNIFVNSPEWIDSNTNDIKKPYRNLHWSGILGCNLRDLCKKTEVDLDEYYETLYKTNSKFTHASPILLNMYSRGNSFGPLPLHIHVARFAILASYFSLETMKLYSDFFGLPYISSEYDELQQMFLDCMAKC